MGEKKYCGQCGNPVGSNFCFACGAPVRTPPSDFPASAAQPRRDGSSATGVPGSQLGVGDHPRGTRWKPILFVTLVGTLLLLIGGSALWWAGAREPATPGALPVPATPTQASTQPTSPTSQGADTSGQIPTKTGYFRLPDGMVGAVRFVGNRAYFVEAFPGDAGTLPIESDAPFCYWGSSQGGQYPTYNMRTILQRSDGSEVSAGTWNIGIAVDSDGNPHLSRYNVPDQPDVVRADSAGPDPTVYGPFDSGYVPKVAMSTLLDECARH